MLFTPCTYTLISHMDIYIYIYTYMYLFLDCCAVLFNKVLCESRCRQKRRRGFRRVAPSCFCLANKFNCCEDTYTNHFEVLHALLFDEVLCELSRQQKHDVENLPTSFFFFSFSDGSKYYFDLLRRSSKLLYIYLSNVVVLLLLLLSILISSNKAFNKWQSLKFLL